jgi:glycerol-3-phosphate acyltransferase PlsY
MLQIILIIIISYIIGSIPTAIIAGKLLRNIDIREYGSGNAGATNVFRVLGWKAGLIVLLIDIFKGFAPVYWLVSLIPDASITADSRIYYQIIIGISAIAGHIWTIFAGFRGGKGVGTAAGVFLGLEPLPVLVCLIVFIILVIKTRYVSLGSITAAVLLPIILFLKKYFLHFDVPIAMIILSILLAGLILLTHKENIRRLIQGKENKLSFSKSEGIT